MRGPVAPDSAAIDMIEIGQAGGGPNLAFNRPWRRNALDMDMIHGLAGALAPDNNSMPC
jgi:hypothetical protein